MREVLENRAELYMALNQEPAEVEAEEGPTLEELMLQEHLKLQEEIAKKETETAGEAKQ